MASGTPFDPCRQWLGISALELNDPRRLLGLEPSDNDPIHILQAAEARLAHLQAVDAGSFEVARRALVARVEEARDRLLATATHSPQPPAAGGGYAMPPAPPQQTSPYEEEIPTESMTVDAGWQPQQPYQQSYQPFQQPYQPPPGQPQGYAAPAPATPGFPTAGYPSPQGGGFPQQSGFPSTGFPPAAGYAPGGGAPPGGSFPGGPAYPPGYRPGDPLYSARSTNMPLVLLIGALVATVGLIAVFVNPFDNDKPARTKKPTTTAKNATTKTADRNSDRKSGDKTARQVASKERPDRQSPDDDAERMEGSAARSQNAGGMKQPAPGDDAAETAAIKPSPQPAPPAPEPPKPEPPKPEPPKPEPPKPTVPKPADGPDPLAKIDEAVKRCRAALASRDFDAAERDLKAVADMAPDKREANRISGWLQLVTYAKGFLEYRNQALAAAKPGDEYDVGSKKIAVVEVADDSFTAKVAGQVKTWSRDAIPGAVLQAIVTSWFDAKPANQLYLGAYHFTKPEPDFDQAEACWNKGKAGGADASLLLPLLSDPVVVDGGDPAASK